MTAYSEDYYRCLEEATSRSAREVVPVILQLIQPRHVIDVGCGIGLWLSAFRDQGVQEVWGVDGNWVDQKMLRFPAERFSAVELKKPLTMDRRFDLVLSLEVAEHLPPESAEIFVDSLTSLGPVVLFSAAVPFQGGTDHLNEQWPDYWAAYFLKRGYLPVDCLRKRIWHNENIQWWYIQNSLFFVSQQRLKDDPRLEAESQSALTSPLSVIHPRSYLAIMNRMMELQKRASELDQWSLSLQQEVSNLKELKPGSVSLKKILKSLPSLAQYALKQKLKWGILKGGSRPGPPPA